MNITVDTRGFNEAVKILDSLPDKLQAKTIRDMFKKAGKPIINDARSRVMAHNANHAKLADAIGFITARGAKNPVIIIGIRAKGQYKYTGYYGHWVEYGVAGVKSKASNSMVKKSGDDVWRMLVARTPKGGQYRHDMPAQPFMRPAIDANRTGVHDAIVVELQTHLHAEAEKAVGKYRAKGGGYAAAKNRAG